MCTQSAPELERLLGEDLDTEQTAVFEQHSKTGTSNRGPGFSVQGAKGGGSHATSPDNPALAAEEELTEEDELVLPQLPLMQSKAAAHKCTLHACSVARTPFHLHLHLCLCFHPFDVSNDPQLSVCYLSDS